MDARSPLLLLALLLAATAPACRTARPVFGPQGTVQQQQLDASVFDPFADTQAGPEVLGGRPQGYQKPWSEAKRSQTLRGG